MIARGQRGKRWRWRSELLLAVFMNRMRVGAAADKTLSRERRRVVVHHGVRMTRLHCLEPCWSPTSQWGGCQLHERTSAVDPAVAGNRAPSAQGLRRCGNKAPNEFATAPRALGGVLSRWTVSHCSVTIPFDRYTPATFDQRASGVRKNVIFSSSSGEAAFVLIRRVSPRAFDCTLWIPIYITTALWIPVSVTSH